MTKGLCRQSEKQAYPVGGDLEKGRKTGNVLYSS